MDTKGGFKERLYALRREQGLSQSDLARKIWGTTVDKKGNPVARNRDRISAYEGGRAVPERSNLEAVAEALGVSVADLAPDLVLENPRGLGVSTAAPFSMRVVPGGVSAHVTLDMILPLHVAAQIAGLIGGHTGLGV